MRENKRKNKKIVRKRKIKLALGILAVLFLAGSGVYIYTTQGKKLPYISPLAQNVLGSSQESVNDLDEIKKEIKKTKVEHENIYETGESYIVLLENKSQIILSKNKSIKSQLASLQFILTRLTMEGKLFTQLDLRFDKPVIRLK